MTEAEKACSKRKLLEKQFYQSKDSIDLTIVSPEEARLRIERLDVICAQYHSIQDDIEGILVESSDDEELDAQIQKRIDFENQFYSLKAKLTSIVNSGKPSTSSTSEISKPSPNDHHDHHQRFPEIVLPTFDGKVEDFPAFLDMFDASIHKSRLQDVQKLHHLKSAFKGDAFTFIKQFPTVGEKYKLARLTYHWPVL